MGKQKIKKAVQSTVQSENTAKMTAKNRPYDCIITDSVLSTVEPYKTIWNYIRCGEENAIHAKELERLTELENRPLRKCIEQLRRSGYIIVASEKGYFRPKTQSELKQYILTEENRAESLLCTISSARELYSSLYGGVI